MRNIDDLFTELSRSRFRCRFSLPEKEAEYLKEKGLPTILEHAREFIKTRIAPANPSNDGKQTPMKKHPVFIAQHATATCCRACLEKWHYIPQGKPLNTQEIDYILSVIEQWLQRQKI